MQLIIIAGQARVGKTTLANIMGPKIFDLDFIPKYMCFAGPLKELAESKGMSKEASPEVYREFCQRIGAEEREKNPDYWVQRFEAQLLEIIAQEDRDREAGKTYWERCVIVDDCRYPNEVQLGLKYSAKFIFLSPGNRALEDPDAEWRNHHSEDMAKTIDSGPSKFRQVFDYVIKNQGSIEDLEEKVEPMIPLWCGATVETLAKYPKDEHMEDLSRCVSELIDLLLIGDMLDEEYEDDDDEEETPDSDD